MIFLLLALGWRVACYLEVYISEVMKEHLLFPWSWPWRRENSEIAISSGDHISPMNIRSYRDFKLWSRLMRAHAVHRQDLAIDELDRYEAQLDKDWYLGFTTTFLLVVEVKNSSISQQRGSQLLSLYTDCLTVQCHRVFCFDRHPWTKPCLSPRDPMLFRKMLFQATLRHPRRKRSRDPSGALELRERHRLVMNIGLSCWSVLQEVFYF